MIILFLICLPLRLLYFAVCVHQRSRLGDGGDEPRCLDPIPRLESVNVVAPPPQPHGETNPSRPPSIVQEFPARNAEGTPTEGGEDIVGGGDALLLLGASEILVRSGRGIHPSRALDPGRAAHLRSVHETFVG